VALLCVREEHAGELLHTEQVATHDVVCLAVVDNQCEIVADYPGMLCVHSVIVWHTIVFQGNTGDYFICSDLLERIEVTLVDCMFDFREVKKTNSIILVTTNFLYVKKKTLLPQCSH
jgi:hypothetical protein